MRSRIPLLALSMLCLPGCGLTLVRVDEAFRRDADWADYSRVIVRTLNGSLELVTGADEGVRVEGRLFAGGTTLSEAQANLAALDVRISPDEADPGALRVEFVYPDSLRNRGIGAAMVIHTPESCAVDMVTGNGAISVSDIQGPSVLRTSNGSVKSLGVAGALVVETSNGSIVAERVDGRFDAQTSNGAVFARQITGECRLGSSNGKIEATQIVGGVHASTSNGGIVVQAAPAGSADFSLDTSNGAIRVDVPMTVALDLDMASSNGRVHTELGEASISNLRLSKSAVSGKLNGGGAGKLYARTSNGSITLSCAK